MIFLNRQETFSFMKLSNKVFLFIILNCIKSYLGFHKRHCFVILFYKFCYYHNYLINVWEQLVLARCLKFRGVLQIHIRPCLIKKTYNFYYNCLAVLVVK